MKKLLPLALVAIAAHGQVWTKSYDSARSSETRVETDLKPDEIKAKGMVLTARIPVNDPTGKIPGDAIGGEAFPLVMEGRMILQSNSNVIRGVQPRGGAQMWQTGQLCVPINSRQGDNGNDMWHTNDKFGSMSTAVGDPDTHKMYAVLFCSKDGSGSYESTTQRMFVLDYRTGQVLANVLVDGEDQGMRYSDASRKQRAAILLWRKGGVKMPVVLAGSFSENGDKATGWLLAFDTFDNRFKAALSTKAGGWMSGQGPAEDMKTGLIYLGLGNGPYDGKHKFGEAALQVRLTPPTATTKASFTVLHSWAPFADDQRTCKKVYPMVKIAGENAPTDSMGLTAAQRDVPGAAMPMADTDCSAEWGDQDAHLTGTLVGNRYITAGKDGIAMIFDTTAFPDTKPADFGNLKANCAKIKETQAGWNLGVDSCPTNAPALNRLFDGKTRHQHAPIAQYHAPSGNTYLLFCGENSPLQVNRLNSDGSLSYIARSVEVASSAVQSGMPGCFTTVSSNGGADAMAWSSFPLGDANRTRTTGFLAGFDLTHLEDKVPTLPTVWKSAAYSFNKFSQPLVYNGTVTLLDGSGSAMQYEVKQ